MHDRVVDAAIAEPKRRKVRKLAVALPVGNSVVELVAGHYVKAVNRIWGAKVGEYLSAPDARRHLWHACFASRHSSFRYQIAAAATRLYSRLTYAPGKELASQAYGDCPPGLLRCLGRLGAEPRSGYDGGLFAFASNVRLRAERVRQRVSRKGSERSDIDALNL